MVDFILYLTDWATFWKISATNFPKKLAHCLGNIEKCPPFLSKMFGAYFLVNSGGKVGYFHTNNCWTDFQKNKIVYLGYLL